MGLGYFYALIRGSFFNRFYPRPEFFSIEKNRHFRALKIYILYILT